MARSDLLEYLQRYRETPSRRLARIERWRRREWRRKHVADAADALAADLFAADLGDGDRIGMYVKDGPPWAAALFGVLRAGGVAVPVDPAHPPASSARLSSRLGLAAWITDEELPAIDVDVPCFELRWRPPASRRPRARGALAATAMPPWPPDLAGRAAQVVLTSGTTAEPQSVELRHEHLRSVLDSLAGEIARYRSLIRVAPRLRLAVALPLSHLYGQYMGVLLPVLLDADVAILDNMPAADLAAAIRRERAWALASVPHTLSSVLRLLLQEGRDTWGEAELQRRLTAAADLSWPRRVLLFDPLRRRLGRRLVAVVSGGASLDERVERLWKLLGYVVVQGYGLTEAAPLVTLNHPFRARQGSIGTPLPGVEVRLGEDGEILVRGGNVAVPSQRGPQVDAEGWLHTGDLGEVLDDGSIRFRGRRSDRIVTPAGVNVDAGAVAATLRAVPEVVDALVLERPWGEPGAVCAVLVVYPGADVDAAVRRANRELGDAARVRSWFVWPRGDLPRTSTGKVRRPPVLAWLAEQAPGGAGSARMAPRVTSASAKAPGEAANVIEPVASGGDGDARLFSRDGGARAVDRVMVALAAAGDTERTEPTADARPEAGAPLPDATIGEILSSLERVELAARIEALYGIRLDDDLFAADPTVGELGARLRSAESAASSDRSPDARPELADRTDRPSDRFAPMSPSPAVSASPRPHISKDPPDAAPWRHRWPTRAVRFLLREGIMHPLARALLRIEIESSVPVEELPDPFLLAVNHASFIDPVVMFALPPRLRARLAPAARWNFFTERSRGKGLYYCAVLWLNLFPLVQLGDWRPTLRIAGELADRDHSILIYPEGEISRDDELHPFKQGVAVMSRELHLPIVPCATAGIERVLPPDSRRLRRASWRRPRVQVCIGEPLPPVRPGERLAARVQELERHVRRLRERARAAMR